MPVCASHVSVRNLKTPCPLSLLNALHEDYVDRSTWLDSYNKEKDTFIENDTYVEISLQEYRRLRRFPKSVPKAILFMCVMGIKQDENMGPDCATCIVVLVASR